MFAERLKKSILQAAIQGQLTEQLPTDGDARHLLKKIRAKKSKLIADKKIKADKILPPITDDEIPFDLPANWCWARLPEIIYNVGSKANQVLAKEVNETGKYPAISQGQQFIDGYVDSANKLVFDVPAIMFGDHTRNVKYIDFPFVISADGTKFLKPIFLEPKYFYWWMVLTAYSLHNRGYNRHYKLLKLELFPLPPLAEQKRIVERVDALLIEVDELARAERELVELEKNFPRRMKNSLLQAAIQGQLTEQLPTDGDACHLLKKIRAKKSKLIAGKKIKADKILPPITDDEIPFDLPDNWCWCRLGEVCDTNIGLTYSPQDVVDDGIIVLRSGNIIDGKINYNELVKVNLEIPENKLANIGDILICVRNGSKRLVGKAAVIDKDGVSFGAFMAVVRSAINPYIFKVISSPYFRRALIDDVGTTTINQITQNMLKKFLFPLPPLAEQKRIVERLNELLPLCDW